MNLTLIAGAVLLWLGGFLSGYGVCCLKERQLAKHRRATQEWIAKLRESHELIAPGLWMPKSQMNLGRCSMHGEWSRCDGGRVCPMCEQEHGDDLKERQGKIAYLYDTLREIRVLAAEGQCSKIRELIDECGA